MNSLSSKTHKTITHLLLSSLSSRTFHISLFSTSTSPSPRRHWGQHGEEESRNVKVSVWWDIKDCFIRRGTNPYKIAQSITQAVRVNGIKGPLHISAFGDFSRVSMAYEALSVTGVNLVHVPDASAAEGVILMDILYWVSQNPPPAHIFLISSDRKFAGVLHRLRMNNYNILLASVPWDASPALCSASTIMWNWRELSQGENLSGRRFNQPPDGPFNSWYGQFRGPLEDPFEEQPELKRPAKPNDSSDEEVSLEKVQLVPMAVLKEIQRIVSSYPNGVSSNELYDQLRKSQVILDRNYYGYKKFSCFLLSIPHVVEVVRAADRVLLVRPVSSNVREPTESLDAAESLKSKNGIQEEVQSNAKAEIEPMLPVPSNVAKEEAVEKKVAETSEKVLKETETSGQMDESPPEKNPKSVTGFFKRLWTKWFRRSNSSIETERRKHDILDEFHAPNNSPQESISNEGSTKSTNQSEIRTASGSTSCVLSMDTKSTIIDKLPVKSPAEPSNQESKLREDSIKCKDGQNAMKDKLFHDESFWRAIKSFLETCNRSHVLLRSKSRDEFARRLQVSGPLIVQSLQESDLLHLVDVLVSEKKWLTEHLSKNPRFRIVIPPEKSSKSSQLHKKNGLSSLFSNSSDENPRSIVAPIFGKKYLQKSSAEILGDCKKLLDELLKQQSGGLNLSVFKYRFELEYGYPLDYQKLGYPKLVSLLRIMPGVKVECGQVFPDPEIGGTLVNEADSCSSDGEIIDPTRSHEDVESSSWEELGPVSEKLDTSKQEVGSDKDMTNHEYEEPCASEDDELSDPDEEEDSPTRSKDEDQSRSRLNEDESSLLQILDSWYSSKDGNSPPRSHSSDVDSLEEYGDKHEITTYHAEKREKKRYIFVSESEENQRQSDQRRAG